jgi:RNA 3'-terminal phosphate cyclase
MFTGFGRCGVARQIVATRLCREAMRVLKPGTLLNFLMADQILLPLALCRGEDFSRISTLIKDGRVLGVKYGMDKR